MIYTDLMDKIKKEGHVYATRIGAYGDDPQGAILAKLREEVDELENAFALGSEPDTGSFKDDVHAGMKVKKSFEKWIKNTDADELADIIITCLAACEELGVDIETHLLLKQSYNQIR